MLTKGQKIALKIIFNSPLAKIATWGGGTALSEIYLKHRASSDIDIFLSQMPPLTEITLLANEIKKALGVKTMASFSIMNRFQYVFEYKESELKLEFVYYPFAKLATDKQVGKIKVESLLDIAVSKTLTSYQRQEPKDALDMYFLLQKYTLKRLIAGVEKKFGEQIDSAHLLAKLTRNLTGYQAIKPLLYNKISRGMIKKFFQKKFNQLKF